MLNCRTLETKLVPFPDRETVLAVIPSGVQRRLAGSTYNRRVRECGRALEKIRDARPSLACLGELTAEDLSDLRLTPTLARRVRHVVFENQRVRSAVESLTRGDLASFGRRMFESHESLSRDFEVSCPELDAIVDTARSLPDAVIGAKMTGAGFGGAVVAVVRKSRLKIFERAFRRHPGVLLARTSDGAGVTRGRGTP
jgi:galactokinase